MKKNKTNLPNPVLAALVCLLAIIAGCSGPLNSPAVGSADGSITNNFQLPFPIDDSSGHIASAIVESAVDGSVFWAKTDGAVVNGTHMNISAPLGGVEYVVYRHEIGLETSLTDLNVDFTATGEGAWVAIADYSTNLWQFSGPFTTSQDITVDTGSFLSTNFNNFFVALIAVDGTSVNVTSSTLGYDNQVVPPATYTGTMGAVFNANCMPCHSSGSATSGIVLDSYWQAFDDADAALAKILADHAPTGSGSMTQEEKEFFQSWVDGGKEYGEAVTYTNFVVSLTTNSCSPCHIGGSSGGVNWTTYAGSAPNGAAAWNRIKAETMPQGGPPLSDPDKDKWLAWVEQGVPE